MKKAGMGFKLNNDQTILIIIFLIVIVFIFGMKPIYQTFTKIKNGTLFNNGEVNTPPVVTPEKPKDEYKILKPTGASNVLCKKVISEEGGDKTIRANIYYTNREVKSIKEDISFSSITDEYTNYMLSEQSKYKQRKSNNLKNIGYSIEIDLQSTNTLKVSSVYLLDRTDLTDIELSKENDKLEVVGQLNQDVYELAQEYALLGYECEW